MKPEGSRALRLCLHGRRYAEFVVNEICLHGRRYANSSGTKFGRNSQVNTGIVGRQCVAMASISRSLRVRDPQKIYPRSMWNVDVGMPNSSGTKFACMDGGMPNSSGTKFACMDAGMPNSSGTKFGRNDVIPLPDRHRLRRIGPLSNLLFPRQKRTLNWQHLLGFGYDLVGFDQSMTA